MCKVNIQFCTKKIIKKLQKKKKEKKRKKGPK